MCDEILITDPVVLLNKNFPSCLPMDSSGVSKEQLRSRFCFKDYPDNPEDEQEFSEFKLEAVGELLLHVQSQHTSPELGRVAPQFQTSGTDAGCF